jgi:hypothetical protein
MNDSEDSEVTLHGSPIGQTERQRKRCAASVSPGAARADRARHGRTAA